MCDCVGKEFFFQSAFFFSQSIYLYIYFQTLSRGPGFPRGHLNVSQWHVKHFNQRVGSYVCRIGGILLPKLIERAKLMGRQAAVAVKRRVIVWMGTMMNATRKGKVVAVKCRKAGCFKLSPDTCQQIISMLLGISITPARQTCHWTMALATVGWKKK